MASNIRSIIKEYIFNYPNNGTSCFSGCIIVWNKLLPAENPAVKPHRYSIIMMVCFETILYLYQIEMVSVCYKHLPDDWGCELFHDARGSEFYRKYVQVDQGLEDIRTIIQCLSSPFRIVMKTFLLCPVSSQYSQRCLSLMGWLKGQSAWNAVHE